MNLNRSLKPTVVSLEEIAKKQYMDAVEDVTNQIRNGDAEKVVIATIHENEF